MNRPLEFSCEALADGYIRIVAEGYTAAMADSKGKVEFFRTLTEDEKAEAKKALADLWIARNAPHLVSAKEAAPVIVCPDCGGPMKVNAGNQKRCRDCTSKIRAPGEFRAAKKQESKKEFDVMPKTEGSYKKKTCRVCKMEFTPGGPRAEFCGDKCRNAAKAAAKPAVPKKAKGRTAVIPVSLAPKRKETCEIPQGASGDGLTIINIPLMMAVRSFSGRLEFTSGMVFDGEVSREGNTVKIENASIELPEGL